MPHWNPVLHRTGETLHLFFKVGIYPKRWRTYASQRPIDGGVGDSVVGDEWSTPRELVPGDEGGRGPVKNKLLVDADGAWLAPASLERDEGWDCFVDRSEDQGRSWEAGTPVPLNRSALQGPGIIQPSLWSSDDGLHMLARSGEGRAYRADSADGGRTWSTGYPLDLPNNNCGLDLLQLEGGALVLACNPVEEPWGPRTPLCLFLSLDNGFAWEQVAVLEESPDEEDEFSYPAIVATPGGFAVSYTWRRERIEVCTFEVG
jgi:predicted neuraminidase